VVATSISLVFLLGVAGLAVDIGRMYITKNEAQAYVDSASLNAAMQLDGTSAGITRATNASGHDTDKWRFDTTPFSSVTTTFGTPSTGPFTATPPNPPTNYNYVRAVAVVNLPMGRRLGNLDRIVSCFGRAEAGGPIVRVGDFA
jgi:uncharacterized membrane protein